MTPCDRTFDESLLSGYLDGALTQGDAQRVRLHLEECAACRAQVEEMESLREVTMTTRFEMPADDLWDERPRGFLSRLSLSLGWTLLLVWVVGITGFALGQIWSSEEDPIVRLLVFGGLSGAALVFLSVLIDRLKTLKTDRYRGVER